MRVQRFADLDAAEYTRLMQRSAADVQRVLPQVQAIMEAVRERGDAAVREFSARFDGVQLHDVPRQRRGNGRRPPAGRASPDRESATRP